MPIFAPYYRVSRADLKRGISLHIQRDVCEPFATREGWQLTAPYIDEGKSAYTDNIARRPAFQQLLADAQRKSFDGVLVYKYDRFARRVHVYFPVIQDLERRGLLVRSATESPDWLSRAFSGVIAEQYSRMLSERMRDVRLWEAQQGRIVGPVPLGYDRVQGIGVPNDDAPRILAIGRAFASGQRSVASLAREFDLNIWQLEEILKNPIYAGFVTCGDFTGPGKHPAIWDTELWAQIQAAHDLRRRRRIQAPRVHAPLLGGIARCAACGAPMWHHPGRARHYECAGARSNKTFIPGLVCSGEMVHAETVEAIVMALVAALVALPEVVDQARALARAERPAPPSVNHDAELLALKRQFLNEAISASEYERRRAALLAAPTPIPPPSASTDAVLALLADIPALLAEATPAERRPLIAQLIATVYVRRRSVLAIQPTTTAAALFNAAAARSSEWAAMALTIAGSGGPGGDRTHDTRLKRPLLYH